MRRPGTTATARPPRLQPAGNATARARVPRATQRTSSSGRHTASHESAPSGSSTADLGRTAGDASVSLDFLGAGRGLGEFGRRANAMPRFPEERLSHYDYGRGSNGPPHAAQPPYSLREKPASLHSGNPSSRRQVNLGRCQGQSIAANAGPGQPASTPTPTSSLAATGSLRKTDALRAADLFPSSINPQIGFPEVTPARRAFPAAPARAGAATASTTPGHRRRSRRDTLRWGSLPKAPPPPLQPRADCRPPRALRQRPAQGERRRCGPTGPRAARGGKRRVAGRAARRPLGGPRNGGRLTPATHTYLQDELTQPRLPRSLSRWRGAQFEGGRPRHCRGESGYCSQRPRRAPDRRLAARRE